MSKCGRRVAEKHHAKAGEGGIENAAADIIGLGVQLPEVHPQVCRRAPAGDIEHGL